MIFKKYIKSLLIVVSVTLIMNKSILFVNALDLESNNNIKSYKRKNVKEIDISNKFVDESFRRDIVEKVLDNRDDPLTNEVASKDNYKIYESDLNKIESCLELDLHKNPDVSNPNKIDNLDGIENFRNLEKLDCSSNNLERVKFSLSLVYICRYRRAYTLQCQCGRRALEHTLSNRKEIQWESQC
ncbi:hypothetical protein BGU70_17405 [Clostridioides difficile]|uniref:hypothetical protein n=1 Tax=Clostridioides difficile TaxID=1496 RepID=UPI000BC4112A|nr:hypothetical protein [Clostridioides difficile]PBH94826.1 hypothetical protein BGU70_17405 [Clostridioides difficile]